ncbi:MAG: hypothetical protein Q9217_000027 [Psora testacea]
MGLIPNTPGPGGFLQATLPSPPPSSDTQSTNTPPILPRPRATPLRPGSLKQSSLIHYADNKLLAISRRYEKRFNAGLESDGTEDAESRGYNDFGEMARDLEGVIDIVWVSGTLVLASLQIPYLLTIALTTCSSLPSFPLSPRSTFHLLNKLDVAFYSLLRGADAESGEQLPGFEGGRGNLSTTEKVRLRGLVERTRVAVVEVAGKEQDVSETESIAQMDGDITTDNDDVATMDKLEMDGKDGRWEMEIARVYEKTIVELGASLNSSGTGGLV